MAALQAQNAQKLDEIRCTVDEQLQDALQKRAVSYTHLDVYKRQIQDLANAVKFITAHAGQFGVQPENYALVRCV